jgi:hypothetical protein
VDAPPLPDLRRLLTSAVESISQDDGWALLSALGSYLTKTNASFDPRNYGYSKLSALARAQDYLEVGQGEGATSLRVRMKTSAPAKAATKTTRRRTATKTQKAAAKKA